MLTKSADINSQLMAAYDRNYYESLYRQIRFAFGDSIERQSTIGYLHIDGLFPYFLDISPRFLEQGISRRIIQSALYGLATNAYNDPEPESPDVDKMTNMVRKAFYRARATGNGRADGEWSDQDARVFMEGLSLGVGFAQIGLVKGLNGLSRIEVKHVPTLNVLWDPYKYEVSKAEFICFVHYMKATEFRARYGKELAGQYVVKRPVTDYNDIASELEYARVFEYYDMGVGGGEPTYAVIPGDIDQRPIVRTANPFKRLPFAHMSNSPIPGLRRPLGSIQMQVSTQSAINDVERRMRVISRKGPIDLVDSSQLDELDMESIGRGDPSPFVRVKQNLKDVPTIERVPAAEIGNTTLEYMQQLERQFNADSGTTDFDRGNMQQTRRTLGENQLLDMRSQTRGSWATKQVMLYHRRKIEAVFEIAAEFDREPFTLNIDGRPIDMNVPGRPETSIKMWLERPSRVVISEDQLRKTDLDLERQMRLQQLLTVTPTFMQSQRVDVQWLINEMLKAIGVTDPQEATAGSPYAIQQQQAAEQAAEQQVSSAQEPGAQFANPYQERAVEKAAVTPPFIRPGLSMTNTPDMQGNDTGIAPIPQ